MVKQSYNRGFTLVEMLLVCCVVVFIFILCALPFAANQLFELNDTAFQYCQLQAMADQEQCTINDRLWFNKDGNINHGQTQVFGHQICTFQLGFGRFRCVKH